MSHVKISRRKTRNAADNSPSAASVRRRLPPKYSAAEMLTSAITAAPKSGFRPANGLRSSFTLCGLAEDRRDAKHKVGRLGPSRWRNGRDGSPSHPKLP